MKGVATAMEARQVLQTWDLNMFVVLGDSLPCHACSFQCCSLCGLMAYAHTYAARGRHFGQDLDTLGSEKLVFDRSGHGQTIDGTLYRRPEQFVPYAHAPYHRPGLLPEAAERWKHNAPAKMFMPAACGNITPQVTQTSHVLLA